MKAMSRKAKSKKPARNQMSLLERLDEPIVVSRRGQLVDKLGEIRAQIADLQHKELLIRRELSKNLNGNGVVEGSTFKFVLSTFSQVKVLAR